MTLFYIGIFILSLLALAVVGWPLLKVRGPEKWLLVVLAVAVIAGAGIIYWQLGAYHSWTIQQALAKRTELQQQYLDSSDKSLIPQVQAANQRLLTVLVDALSEHPERSNLQLSILYARTLVGVARYDEAVDEFQYILSVEPDSTQIRSEMAQALGLAGIAAFQSRDYREAIGYWQKAVNIQGLESPNAQALYSGIAKAREYLSQQDKIRVSNSQVTVNVTIADIEDVRPDDTVFVYVRAWQGARMPLAIQRLQVKNLPKTITLTDDMAMVSGMNLSSVEQVELVARVSRSGSPVPQAGDWQASYGPVDIKQRKEYELLIKEPVL